MDGGDDISNIARGTGCTELCLVEEALPFLIGERTGDSLLRQRDQPVETDTQVAAVDEALTGARPERAGVPGDHDEFTIG